MKKFFIIFLVLVSFLFIDFNFINNSFAWVEDKSYMIDTDSLFWQNSSIKTWTAKDTVENTLTTIVQKLMIAFWVLSLFIMTIGWGYMIFAAWKDEMLSKWKSIFSAWLIALAIALISSIIIKLVIYLLY